MSRPTGLLVVVAVITGLAASLRGQSEGIVPIPDYAGVDFTRFGVRPYLTGDWGGQRTELAEQGFTFDLNYTQLSQAVVDGGRNETGRYGGRLQFRVNVDLDRMDVMPGAMLTVRTENRYGRSVNEAAGTLLPVADMMFFPLTEPHDDDVPLAVTEILYTQFLSPVLAMFGGKFTILGADANEFAGGDGTTQFLGHAFTSASVTSLFNPYSTVGGGFLYMPSKQLAVSSSLYASRDSSTTVGLDTLDDGLVWSTSVAAQYRYDELPGGWRANFQYAFDRRFVDFDGQFVTPSGVSLPFEGESWCLFTNAWQYLSVDEDATDPINVNDGRTDLRGYGAFLRLGFADEDTNPIEWVISGGLGGKGLLDGREHDTWGVGLAFSETSNLPFGGLPIENSSTRFEAYYGLALSPASELTFDLQWADSLLANESSATVLGARWRVRF